MVLYIHGFASCGEGNKSRTLKKHLKDVMAPNLPIRPKEAVKYLDEIIANNDIDMLVGSSLGGFYATYLGQKHNKRGVLINPSVRPYNTLKKSLGINRRFCDGAEFEWKEEYLKELLNLDVKNLRKNLFLVLLQTGDEVLDYREALKKFSNQRCVVEYGGNHRFENIEDYICMIKNFRGIDGGNRAF